MRRIHLLLSRAYATIAENVLKSVHPGLLSHPERKTPAVLPGVLWSFLCVSVILGAGTFHSTPTAQSRSPSGEKGIILVPDVSGDHDDFYVGSRKCAGCHAEIFRSWSHTKHALDFHKHPAPHSGPCKRCHTTGTEHRVGCEACHGPSGTHSYHPELNKHPACRICKIREKCILCHTRSIDPEFNLSRDLRKVAHGRSKK